VVRKRKDGRNSNTFEKAVSDKKAGAGGYPLEAIRHVVSGLSPRRSWFNLKPVHMGNFRLPQRS
jgi:hypothetical protein